MQVIVVQSLGAVAADILTGNRRGYLAALFERSFYLQSEDGRLICIGSTRIGHAPLHVLCGTSVPRSWKAIRGWRTGLVWQQNEHRQISAGAVIFDWRGARIWHPDAIPATAGRLSAGLIELSRIIENHKQPIGFGVLIRHFIDATLTLYRPGDDPVMDSAVPAIDALICWLQRPLAPPPAAAQALLGLGYGLTPSGDDFLGGLLLALRALGAAQIADRLASALLPVAKTATGAISFAHLQCAAAGAGHAVLHDMLTALHTADRAQIMRCLAGIETIGHSSGWDMFAGIVCGCAILAAGPLPVPGPSSGF